MKKIISLLAAIAMVSSLFVTSAFAYPASVTLVADVAVADADQIEEYEANVDEVPAGYTLLAVTFSQTGLGDWENTNSATTTAQLKKPTGFLPAAIAIKVDFGSDVSNLYSDTDYYYIESPYEFAASFDGSELSLIYGPWTTSQAYPLNAKGESSIAEGDPFAVLYVPVSGSATGTYTEQTVISMKQYSAGTGSGVAEYSTTEGNINLPASLALAAGPSTVAVSGVTVAPKTLSFTVGDSAATLVATVAPNDATDKSVTWTTSNSAVATVANGVVTPVGVGSATITVTTTDGSFTDTCAVTVAAAPVPVTGVTLDKANLDLKVGGTATLVATVAPDDADVKTVQWSSDDPAVATVTDGGVVEAKGVGRATITVASTSDSTKKATCTVVVKAADVTIPAKNAEVGVVDESTVKEFTDLQGKPVTLTKKYGIAKFDPVKDVTKNYFLRATDTNGNENEWAVDFAGLKAEVDGAKVTFFAIIKSASHVIETMELIARAK